MKKIISILILITSINITAQINANSVLRLTNATDAEMNAIPTPNEGSLIYNTTDDGIYKYNGVVWTKIDNSLQSIVLNKDDSPSYSLNGIDDNYHLFPFDAPTDVQSIDSNIFSVSSSGEITVSEAGVYLITGGLSVKDMPETYDFESADFGDVDFGDVTPLSNGFNNAKDELEDLFEEIEDLFNDIDTSNGEFRPIKFILGVFVNNNLVGFLTRGFAVSPGDFWGASGTMIYNLDASDVLTIRYRFDDEDGGGSGTVMEGFFTNLGVTKIK